MVKRPVSAEGRISFGTRHQARHAGEPAHASSAASSSHRPALAASESNGAVANSFRSQAGHVAELGATREPWHVSIIRPPTAERARSNRSNGARLPPGASLSTGLPRDAA